MFIAINQWTAWQGGKAWDDRPVDADAVVWVRKRSGREEKIVAGHHDWQHRPDMGPEADILEFKKTSEMAER